VLVGRLHEILYRKILVSGVGSKKTYIGYFG